MKGKPDWIDNISTVNLQEGDIIILKFDKDKVEMREIVDQSKALAQMLPPNVYVALIDKDIEMEIWRKEEE